MENLLPKSYRNDVLPKSYRNDDGGAPIEFGDSEWLGSVQAYQNSNNDDNGDAKVIGEPAQNQQKKGDARLQKKQLIDGLLKTIGERVSWANKLYRDINPQNQAAARAEYLKQANNLMIIAEKTQDNPQFQQALKCKIRILIDLNKGVQTSPQSQVQYVQPAQPVQQACYVDAQGNQLTSEQAIGGYEFLMILHSASW